MCHQSVLIQILTATKTRKESKNSLDIPSAAEGSAVRPGSLTKLSIPLVPPQNLSCARL